MSSKKFRFFLVTLLLSLTSLPVAGAIFADHTTYLPIVFKPVADLKSQVADHTINLPQPLATETYNWCTWGWCIIGPRLYHEPLANGGTLIGWTDSNGTGHVSRIDSTGSLVGTFDYSSRSVRGLTAHTDGSFAILLFNPSSQRIWLSKRLADGNQVWETDITGPLTVYDPDIGDSRLTYGNGLYAAYFTVYGVSGWVQGHNGDQLTYVDDSGAIQPGGWEWGCSHSMASLISYHPTLDQFLPVCSSDCYSSKGILLNDNQIVYASDGNCGGNVSAQLGQAALAENTWKLVFNAQDMPCCGAQGIGFATIDTAYSSSYTWLTDTDGTTERDPALARLGNALNSDRFLVGWTTTGDGKYWLGVIDGGGSFIIGPEEVTSASISWGERDDSFRTRPDGDVSWVQGDPLSSTIHLFILDGSTYLP